MKFDRIGLTALLALTLTGGSGIGAAAQTGIGVGSSVVVGTASTRYIYGLDSGSVSSSAPITAAATHSFTGQDSAGHTQTMTFSGSGTAQSNYGNLHVYATGTLSNSYYNAANPLFSDENGSLNDPNGSPTAMASLTFATFDETFQFGGTALQNGYKARYIFHVDGTNTGTGTLADLGVTVDANPDDAFFAGDTGFFAADWATHDFAINGITPQNMHVQFSNQVVFNTNELPEGMSYFGTSDFSSTLTLAAVQVVDPNGALASGWTVTSGSGTKYNTLQVGAAAPEPGSLALLAFLAPGALTLTLTAFRRRRKSQFS